MDVLYGWMMYGLSLLTVGGIYAIIALGLNLQWGVTGLFNIGIAGFFAVGAYASAIMTTLSSTNHLGGYNLPIWVGLVASMVFSGLIAFLIGKICLRLRGDYLAISTIGLAEILRLILKNEMWLTSGPRGIPGIPRPFEQFEQPWSEFGFLFVVLAILGLLYIALERAIHSPWGRIMKAIRENEKAAASTGKNVEGLRLQAFVIGSIFMGLGGALLAHSMKFVGPSASDPLTTTFLAWVMLIIGGSGNNRGSILGAFLIWTVWSASELLSGVLSFEWINRLSYFRVFLIGFILQVILQNRPEGIIPEERQDSK
jgi:branched-chain amino acid transport system permease protein